MKKYIISLFLFFCISGSIFCSSDRTKIEASYWQARYFIQNNDLKKAEEILKNIVEADNTFYDAYFSLYEICISQNRLEDALIYLNKLKGTNYKETSLTYDARALNIEEKIKELRKKIEESKKIALPKKKKKKKFLEKLFPASRKEKEKEDILKDIISVKTVYLGENRVRIYKGYTDGLRTGDEIYLIKDKKIIGVVKLTYTAQFSSDGEIIKIDEKEKLTPGEPITENILKRTTYALP